MNNFKIHTKETAPTESAAHLKSAESAYGFIPNLLGVMAESPATLGAYLAVGQLFEESSFSPTERQIVLLTTSRFNQCDYCMGAHTVIAGMQEVPSNIVDAIRNDKPIEIGKLEALRTFTSLVVENRGRLSSTDIEAFLGSGYTMAQILEVILAVSFKTMSNYVNHVAETPLDDAFAAQAWTPPVD